MERLLFHLGVMLGFVCAWACVEFGVRLWAFGLGYCLGLAVIEGVKYLLNTYFGELK